MDDAQAALLAEQVLQGFEISLYRWNLATDALVWNGTRTALMEATGLHRLASGTAFADLREDGGERGAWALAAREGELCRFLFAVPTGPAGVVWVEDCARRVTVEGVPHVAGVLRRVAAPRLARGHTLRSVSERDARAQLLDHLTRASVTEDRSYTIFGIDNLRDVNRVLGPDVTDEIVAEVEARIFAHRPPSAMMGRVGSAKFALAEVGATAQAVTDGVRRVMEGVGRHEIVSTAGPVAVTISAGICHTPRGTRLPSDPMANAQTAFDEGRIGRVEGLRFARPGKGAANERERYSLAARMVMDAIAEKRLTIAYQPVVRAEEPAKIAFHECLTRIVDRDGTLISAGTFMPAIENLGLIRQVDRAILAGALDTLHAHPGLRLSVNLSPQSMNDTEWMTILERGLSDRPDAGDRLILEITESSAILDPARTLAFMNRCRARGCAFALDDFGAGYTSFKHFRDFRFDAVKIDGSFVRGIAKDPDNRILVRTLVTIADHFNMFTVAEFVEDEADATLLRDMGIDCLQGYRYGQPLVNPAWLQHDRPRDRLLA